MILLIIPIHKKNGYHRNYLEGNHLKVIFWNNDDKWVIVERRKNLYLVGKNLSEVPGEVKDFLQVYLIN